MRGWGMPVNREHARTWFKLAHDKGLPDGLYVQLAEHDAAMDPATNGARDKLHAKCVMAFWTIGIGAAMLFAAGLAIRHMGAVAAAVWLMVFGFVTPVYATVAHRVLPFFTSNAVTRFVPWKPNWALGLLLAAAMALGSFAAEAQTKINEAFAGISSELGDVGLAVQRAELRAQGSVLNADLQRLVAWQFFWVDGRVTASPAKAKLWGAWQKLKGQGDDGAIVVLYTQARQGAAADAADAEKPGHYVRFDRGFAMARHAVTVGEFRRFVQATQYRPRATRRGHSIVYDERSGNFVRRSGVDWQSDYAGDPASDDMPVLHVSVYDAEAYAEWLAGQLAVPVLRLPYTLGDGGSQTLFELYQQIIEQLLPLAGKGGADGAG